MNNLTRFLLYGALAFVTVNLYTNWVNRDLKSNVNVPEINLPQEFSYKTPTNLSNRFVKIETPKFMVTIDKLGAKLTSVKLKDYKKELNSAELVELLNNSENSPLIASSGFTGDADLVFTSSLNEYVLGDKATRITLSSVNKQGIVYEKSFTFFPGTFNIKVETTVKNNGTKPWTSNFYMDLISKKSQDFDPSKLPKPESFVAGQETSASSGMFTFNTFTGASYYSPENTYEKVTYQNMAKSPLKTRLKGQWFAIQKRYFINAWVPSDNNNYLLEGHWNEGQSSENNQYVQSFVYTMNGPKNVIQPGDSSSYSAMLYSGPEIATNLAGVPGLEKTIDYGFLWMISSFLFAILEFIHRFIPSWGWSIVILTLLIKLVFYKFSEASFRSLAKMKKLNPRIQAINENFKDDATAKNQAIMDLYKQEKVNPLGGCLPMLLQIPFFIALYYVLIEAIQLRHSPFLWVMDLASKDPYYVLPVLMGTSFLIQQKMSPASQDPVQANMMMAMPVIFTVLFSQFPSGLVLYWLMNNTFSIFQQWWFLKQHPDG